MYQAFFSGPGDKAKEVVYLSTADKSLAPIDFTIELLNLQEIDNI